MSRDDAVSFCEETFASGGGDVIAPIGDVQDVAVTEESGDRANVTVTSSTGDTLDVPVARENGSWKIDVAGMFGDLGDVGTDVPEDLETDFTVPDDLDQQIEDLEAELEDELGTDFTIPED